MPKTATEDQLKKAYRKDHVFSHLSCGHVFFFFQTFFSAVSVPFRICEEALKWHPDKNPDNKVLLPTACDILCWRSVSEFRFGHWNPQEVTEGKFKEILAV